MAQRALEQGRHEYKYIDIYREGISKEDLAERLGKPVRTVPQILHGDKYIGGYTELYSYLSTL
jgi:glutaredoxin 1